MKEKDFKETQINETEEFLKHLHNFPYVTKLHGRSCNSWCSMTIA